MTDSEKVYSLLNDFMFKFVYSDRYEKLGTKLPIELESEEYIRYEIKNGDIRKNILTFI